MGFSAGQQPILDSPTRSPVLVPVSYCKAPAELIQDRQSDYRSGSKKVVAHLCGVRVPVWDLGGSVRSVVKFHMQYQ